jgi:hypothetical protein
MKAEKYLFRLIFCHLTTFLPLPSRQRRERGKRGERSLLCEDIWRFIIPLNPPFSKGDYSKFPLLKGELQFPLFQRGIRENPPFLKGDQRGIKILMQKRQREAKKDRKRSTNEIQESHILPFQKKRVSLIRF